MLKSLLIFTMNFSEDYEEDGTHEEEASASQILEVLPIPESRELTEKEEKRLRRKEDGILRELRIFLRETWNKINREQRFFMFRVPIDTVEVNLKKKVFSFY